MLLHVFESSLIVPQRTLIFSHPTRPQNFRIIANIRGLIRGWLRISGFSKATIWYWMQPLDSSTHIPATCTYATKTSVPSWYSLFRSKSNKYVRSCLALKRRLLPRISDTTESVYRPVFFNTTALLYTPKQPARAQKCSCIKKDTSVQFYSYRWKHNSLATLAEILNKGRRGSRLAG